VIRKELCEFELEDRTLGYLIWRKNRKMSILSYNKAGLRRLAGMGDAKRRSFGDRAKQKLA